MTTCAAEPAGGEATCPLCGGPNACALACARATANATKAPSAPSAPGACWCQAVTFPAALLERLPAEQRGKACICEACVREALAREAAAASAVTRPTTPSRSP